LSSNEASRSSMNVMSILSVASTCWSRFYESVSTII
jgi:hypothetical protein